MFLQQTTRDEARERNRHHQTGGKKKRSLDSGEIGGGGGGKRIKEREAAAGGGGRGYGAVRDEKMGEGGGGITDHVCCRGSVELILAVVQGCTARVTLLGFRNVAAANGDGLDWVGPARAVSGHLDHANR